MQPTYRRTARHGSRLSALTRPLLVLLVTFWAGDALAQFTNNTIGFQAGYLGIANPIKVKSGPVLGLESTLYLESGFDLVFRVLGGVHKDRVTEKNAIGFFPSIGIRYLFSEEVLRPYFGLNLSYLQFFGADSMPTTLRVAFTPALGFEYYFQSNTAFGLQGEYQYVLDLNEDGGSAFAGVARISWGF